MSSGSGDDRVDVDSHGGESGFGRTHPLQLGGGIMSLTPFGQPNLLPGYGASARSVL